MFFISPIKANSQILPMIVLACHAFFADGNWCFNMTQNCKAPSTIAFDSFLLLEVRGIPSSVSNSEIKSLETTIKGLYDCPNQRMVGSLSILTDLMTNTSLISMETNFSWLVRIQGTTTVCQSGLFKVPFKRRRTEKKANTFEATSMSPESSSELMDPEVGKANGYRRLPPTHPDIGMSKRELQACDCIPPRQTRFVLLLNIALQQQKEVGIISNAIQQIMNVTELEPMNSLSANTTTWEATIIVEVVANVLTFCANALATAAQEMVLSYNKANTMNPNLCDPTSRVATNAVIQLLSDYNGRPIKGSNRRLFQGPDGLTLRSQTQSSLNVSDAPSQAPSPQAGGKTLFSMAVTMTGNCVGCPSNAILFDISSDRRIISLFDDSDEKGSDQSRNLLQLSNGLYCPAGVASRGPTQQEFLSELLLPSCLSEQVLAVSQVDTMNCSNFTEFQATATVTFVVRNHSLSSNELTFLQSGFVDSYNSLASHFCDSKFRTAKAAQIVNVTMERELKAVTSTVESNAPTISSPPSEVVSDAPSQAPTSQVQVGLSSMLFLVKGSCSGCVSDGISSSLFDAVSRRQIETFDSSSREGMYDSGNRRRAQITSNSSGLCYCDRGAIFGTPTLEAFTQAFKDFISLNGQLFPDIYGVYLVQQPKSFALSSSSPSNFPSFYPSSLPSEFPSEFPSQRPSRSPSSDPSTRPSQTPSKDSSVQPLPSLSKPSGPSNRPSKYPSEEPFKYPSSRPLHAPPISIETSGRPSTDPSSQPSREPSKDPSGRPSQHPSIQPSFKPSTEPSRQPSREPSRVSSGQPSTHPSDEPSIRPSMDPSALPSHRPSKQPSVAPSPQPSHCTCSEPVDVRADFASSGSPDAIEDGVGTSSSFVTNDCISPIPSRKGTSHWYLYTAPDDMTVRIMTCPIVGSDPTLFRVWKLGCQKDPTGAAGTTFPRTYCPETCIGISATLACPTTGQDGSSLQWSVTKGSNYAIQWGM